jgi:hypothetical protein
LADQLEGPPDMQRPGEDGYQISSKRVYQEVDSPLG